MVDKIQVSMWIQTPLKHLVDNENLNLSKFVNDSLEIYFSVGNTKAIEQELSMKKLEIQVLEQRISDIASKKGIVEVQDLIINKAFGELKESWEARMKYSYTEEQDLSWVRSPKNLERCKILKKTPEEVLIELEAWYDGQKTAKHEENR